MILEWSLRITHKYASIRIPKLHHIQKLFPSSFWGCLSILRRYAINSNRLNVPIVFCSIGIIPYIGSPIGDLSSCSKEKNRFAVDLSFRGGHYSTSHTQKKTTHQALIAAVIDNKCICGKKPYLLGRGNQMRIHSLCLTNTIKTGSTTAESSLLWWEYSKMDSHWERFCYIGNARINPNRILIYFPGGFWYYFPPLGQIGVWRMSRCGVVNASCLDITSGAARRLKLK